ncbi:MAG: glycosyltransferase family 39 protein [Candidatus Kapaibacteriota bacterium]
MLNFRSLLTSRVSVYLLFLLAFLYLLIGFNYGLNIYDEGLIVYGANRILHGDVPYKDFWTLYAPGQFYLVAGLFYSFGTELLTERIFSTIILFLLSLVLYWNAGKFVTRKYAVLSVLLFVLWLGEYRFFANPMPSALLLCFVGTTSLLNYFSLKHSNLYLMLAGIATGIATLFRHEIGLVTFLVEQTVIILNVYFTKNPKETFIFKRFFEAVREGVSFFVGFVLVLIPFLIYLLVNVPLDILWYDLFVFPSMVFPKVRSLPFPLPFPNVISVLSGDLSLLQFVKSILLRIHFYFPLIVYIFSVLSIIRLFREKKINLQANLFWGFLLFGSLGLIYFSQVLVRADLAHLLPTYLPASVLFGFLLSEIQRVRKFSLWAYLLVCLIVASVVVKPVFTKLQILSDELTCTAMFRFQIPRAKCIKWEDRGAIYEQALRYVQNSVPPGSKIFVGNLVHERIYINDVMFYFLANRHSATKYYELHPGLATTSAIQKEIIKDIEHAKVEFIVLRSENYFESNQSGKSNGVRLLDEYIRGKYSPTKQFGDYVVWRRNR